MTWDTVQQFIRILMYAAGSYWFGASVETSDLYQAAVGGAVAIGAFVWWFFWERNRSGSSTI